MSIVKAGNALVDDVVKRTASLEGDWIKDANAKGLDGAKVLGEFKDEIRKLTPR